MGKDKLRVVVTDYCFASLENERAVIESAGAELVACQCKTEEEVIEAARSADALLVQWAPITASVIGNLSRCKVIVRYGIGVDNVDLEAASQRGIAICNVPDYCIDEVADHALALALSLIKRIVAADQSVRQGEWNSTASLAIAALGQMKFVTVGYGRTARAVLDRARGFKFRLAACDPYLSRDAEVAPDIELLPFDEAIQTADILSLHVPLSEETNHIIGQSALAKMKSTAFLINTSRGRLVDTAALVRAIEGGEIAGAGLDVFEEEPLRKDDSVLRCNNIIVTPHIAWCSQHSVSSLQRKAAEEAMRALDGERLRSRVT